jgi:predicted acyl esterase
MNAIPQTEDWRDGIRWCAQLPLLSKVGRYPGFRPSRERLRRGQQFARGGCALGIDLLWDRDVGVRLRDGTTIYVDVFRPADVLGPLPAVVAWSPYGKANGGNHSLDEFPFRAGVLQSRLSGLQMWEAPDPAWWCERGYAIVNVDARGAYASEGRMAIWGTQEGRDGHDVVEWIAAQPWSNGHVGFAGNSWLAIVQWFIAAERPPHLAAIAPWEGLCDGFRHNFQGGIIDPAFAETVFKRSVGPNEREDFSAMAKQEPWLSPYWEDKVARLERIEVPCYVVASWTNPVHTPGTFDAWERLGSSDKWLRVHNTMEWPDFYAHDSQVDLLRFFDRYLKGVDNGWEATPRVRVAVLGTEGRDDEVNRALDAFPSESVRHRELHLNAAERTLIPAAPAGAGVARCERPGDSICFDLPIDRDSELIGFSSVRLYVQLHEGSDQDLYIALERLDRRGRRIAARSNPVPHPLLDRLLRTVHRSGCVLPLDLLFPSRAKGRLRLSHRELDVSLSRRERPVPRHRGERPVAPGEVVAVDVAIDPVAWKLEAGQKLRLRIAGHDLAPKALPGVVPAPPRGHSRFSIWCGGACPSHLWVPLVPVRSK